MDRWDRIEFDGIESGDIIFFHSKERFYHRLIRFFTDSHIVHVGVVFWINVEGEEMLMIAEANGGGPRRIVRLRDYIDTTVEFIRPPHGWMDIREKVLIDIGQVEYSWFEAIFVGINEWAERVYGKRLSDSALKFKGEICTQYVCDIFSLDGELMSPARLYDKMVDELGWSVIRHLQIEEK